MAVFSVIKLSDLEGAKRIDAEYYKPEYLEIENKIKNKSINTIREISFFVKKGIFDISPELYTPKGIPFIRIQNIRKGFLVEEDLVFISEASHNIEKKTELTSYDLVLSKVGTIGEVSLIPSKFRKVNFSQNVIGVKIDKSRIYPGYLLTFLLTKFGQFQLERAQMPQVQSKLELEPVRDIKVIRIGGLEEKIHELVLKSENQFELSKSLYIQAENLLLEELGLKDFKPKYKKTYTANLSSAFSAHRIDAEYFQPAYDEIIEKLKEKNIRLEPLRKLILGIQKGTEPGSENYRDEGKPFIRVSNLSIHGFVDRDQKYLSEELYQILKETYEPKPGDLLLTKDATPGIAYVVKEQIEGIISSGILKLQINQNEINKEYLALCINSIIGKMQIEKDGGGSVIIHWKPEQVKKLKIPILPLETQQKIASLVQQSHDARKKAIALLEEAKRRVEEEIENQAAL